MTAAVLWLVSSGLRARSELIVVGAQVRTLRAQISAGDLEHARATASSLAQHARRAHDLTTGPVWALASDVPFLGRPVDTVRATTAGVAAIADRTVPALIEASAGLDPAHLRRSDGSVDLGAIQAAEPKLDHAAGSLQAVIRDIKATHPSTWVGSIDDARHRLLAQLSPLSRTIVNADISARIVPPLFGADGPKSYLVTLQNEAELRGLGGVPSAFAILKADHGRLTFTRFEVDRVLNGVSSGLNLGQTVGAFRQETDATQLYVDSNSNPHFPYAARIWTAMWRKKSGHQVDGAIALDPTTLGYLLAVTGPATLPDGTQVSASNVVELTERTEYSRFGSAYKARTRYLVDIARVASQKVVHGKSDTTALVRAAGRAVREHRLVVWARDQAVEDELAKTPIAGGIPESSAPYAGLALVNSGGTKLDYYLRASLVWRRTGCGPTREVNATIRLVNTAPASGLPAYVLGPTHRGESLPAVNRSTVMYYGSIGAALESVTENGRRVDTARWVEHGHLVIGRGIDLLPHRPRTLVLRLREPAGSGALVLRVQPMVTPVAATVHDQTCGS